MKTYISGPMTGIENYNKQAFYRAETIIKNRGDIPVNPARTDIGNTSGMTNEQTWQAYMKSDIKILMDCDGIYMLKGWESSRGALIELSLAIRMGLSVEYEM